MGVSFPEPQVGTVRIAASFLQVKLAGDWSNDQNAIQKLFIYLFIIS